MKTLLEDLGWSQAYFARRLGVSERTVYHWCKGVPNPAAMAYLKLIKRLIG